MVNKDETGQDTVLSITGGGSAPKDVPVTNISYSADDDTSETQFNTSPHKSIVYTGTSFSGSFEHDGSNEELRSALRNNDGTPKDPDNIQVTVKESERTVIFKHVIVESRSKDMPGDDRTSETYDFVAEKMTVKPN